MSHTNKTHHSLRETRLFTIGALGILGIVAAATLLGGCTEGFDAYNVLAGTRLLAIRAEPPWIRPGESTTLDALVYADAGADQGFTYEWSWCPLRAGTQDGWTCAVPEEQFNDVLASLGYPPAASYSLGDGATATLPYVANPEALAALCSMPAETLPQGTSLPSCADGFPISVGVTLRAGDQEVRGFKDVILTFTADAPTNQNPAIHDVAIAPEDGTLDIAVPIPAQDPPLTVTRGDTYELFATVPEEGAETFLAVPPTGGEPQPTREMLAITWFIEGGLTQKLRSSYLEGASDFTMLTENTWVAPWREDYAPDTTRLILVLRDDRGGISWLSRTLALEGE